MAYGEDCDETLSNDDLPRHLCAMHTCIRFTYLIIHEGFKRDIHPTSKIVLNCNLVVRCEEDAMPMYCIHM